jgi:hypothetical protein
MGYRLFRLGVFEKAGEFKATWGGRQMLIKAAAPGTFFAVLGACIVTVSSWKAVELTQQTREQRQPVDQSEPPVDSRPMVSDDISRRRDALPRRASRPGYVLTSETTRYLGADPANPGRTYKSKETTLEFTDPATGTTDAERITEYTNPATGVIESKSETFRVCVKPARELPLHSTAEHGQPESSPDTR